MGRDWVSSTFWHPFETLAEAETERRCFRLRIISLFPFLAAILSARLIWGRRSKLARTVAVVEVSRRQRDRTVSHIFQR